MGVCYINNNGTILPHFPVDLRSLKQKTKDRFTTSLSQAWIFLQKPVRRLDLSFINAAFVVTKPWGANIVHPNRQL